MASKREMPGLADAVATVISPVLIMAMVGALIFFILEVLYGGEYTSRLRWTFFFFVFGAVLVWWCARKLTWDCTFTDDARDASHRGVLEATGLDNLERPDEWREPEPPADEDEGKPVDPGPIGWIQRYLRWRKVQDKKAHTP